MKKERKKSAIYISRWIYVPTSFVLYIGVCVYSLCSSSGRTRSSMHDSPNLLLCETVNLVFSTLRDEDLYYEIEEVVVYFSSHSLRCLKIVISNELYE